MEKCLEDTYREIWESPIEESFSVLNSVSDTIEFISGVGRWYIGVGAEGVDSCKPKTLEDYEQL